MSLGLLVWKNLHTIWFHQKMLVFLEVLITMSIAGILVSLRFLYPRNIVTTSTEYQSFLAATVPSHFYGRPPTGSRWRIYMVLISKTSKMKYKAIENKLLNESLSNPNIQVIQFNTEDEMIRDYLTLSDIRPSVIGAIIANNKNDGSDEYTIRMPATPKPGISKITELISSWSLNDISLPVPMSGPHQPTVNHDGSPGYYTSGFLMLQMLTYRMVNQDNKSASIRFQRFPIPPYVKDNFGFIAIRILPVSIVAVYLLPICSCFLGFVNENSQGILHHFKTIGVSLYLNLVAWYVVSVIHISIITILFGALISVSNYQLFPQFGIFPIITLFLYGIASISWSMLIAALFNTAIMAGCVYVIFQCCSLLYYTLFLSHGRPSFLVEIVQSFVPSVALPHTFRRIYEHAAFYKDSSKSYVTGELIQEMLPCYTGLVMSTVFAIGLSFDVLRARFFKQQRGPGFFTLASMAFYREMHVSSESSLSDGGDNATHPKKDKAQVSEKTPKRKLLLPKHICFEEAQTDLSVGVSVQKLVKVFRMKPVINKISLDMYHSQITVILGQSSSGKSTFMNLLSGAIIPTSGQIVIERFNLETQSSLAHSMIGVTNQMDVYFPALTVYQHLELYGGLKGFSSEEIQNNSYRLLQQLGIIQYATEKPVHLNLDIRKRMFIAIAFSGNPKVVFLDEPTTDLNSDSRRKVWDLLIKERASRTIVVTTNSAEEADVLGDRIAILANGQLYCCGSPFFLKQNIGIGYHISVSKQPGCNDRVVYDVIATFAPSAVIEKNVVTEMGCKIYRNDQRFFPQLFLYLEEHKSTLEISSFGLSVTTLEEVFIRLSENIQLREIKENDAAAPETLVEAAKRQKKAAIAWHHISSNIERNSWLEIFLQQFWALLHLNVFSSTKNLAFTLTEIFVSLLTLYYITRGIHEGIKRLQQDRSLLLTLDHWSTPFIPILNRTSKNVYKSLVYIAQNAQPPITIVSKNFISEVKNWSIHNDKNAFSYDLGLEMNRDAITIHFSNQKYHTLAVGLALVIDALCKASNMSQSYRVFNHPLPYTLEDQIASLGLLYREGFMYSILAMIITSFVTSGFIQFLSKSRISNSKQLLQAGGVSATAYWLANFMWNMILYIALVVTVLSFYGLTSPRKERHKTYDLTLKFLLFFYAGLSNVLRASLMSFFVRRTHNFHAWHLAFDMASTRGLSNTHRNERAKDICDDPFIQGVMCDVNPKRYGPCCFSSDITCQTEGCVPWSFDPYDWATPGNGRAFMSLLTQIYVGIAVLVYLERRQFNIFRREVVELPEVLPVQENAPAVSGVSTDYVRDDSVVQEVARIRSANAERLKRKHCVILKGVSTVVQNTYMIRESVGVYDVSLAIKNGEAFAILGTKGSGSSALLATMAGIETINSGELIVNGFDSIVDLTKIRWSVGYCPQVDALPEFLTCREILALYSRIKAVPEFVINVIINLLARLFSIEDLDVPIKDLAISEVRRLSIATAFVGRPQIIFLDQPTAQIDPQSKRTIWEALTRLRKLGNINLVIATHSLDECDTLCDRVVILQKGRIKSIGTLRQFRLSLGSGYNITIKVGQSPGRDDVPRPKGRDGYATGRGAPLLDPATAAEINGVKEYVLAKMPDVEFIAQQKTLLIFRLYNPRIPWAEIFEMMEQIKTVFNIADYAVAQMTNQELFQQFITGDGTTRKGNSKLNINI